MLSFQFYRYVNHIPKKNRNEHLFSYTSYIYSGPGDLALTGYIQSQKSVESPEPVRYWAITGRYQSDRSGSSTHSSWQLNGLRGPIPSDNAQRMVNMNNQI